MSSGPYFKPANRYHIFFIPYLRNHWTSEKYLAMIVPLLPFPGNEFLAMPQTCKRSQKPVDQRKIFGIDRASQAFPPQSVPGQRLKLEKVARTNSHPIRKTGGPAKNIWCWSCRAAAITPTRNRRSRQLTANRMILRKNAHTWPKYLKKNFTPHRFGDFSKRPQSPLLRAAGTGPERTQRRNWGLSGRLTENNFGRSLRNMAPTSEGRAEEVYREVFSSSFVSFRQ